MATVLPLSRMGSSSPSNGVRDVDELVLDRVALGKQLAQTPDSERLRGIVPGGHEVDLRLSGIGRHVLSWFPCQERVEPKRHGLRQAVRACAGDDPDASYLLRSRPEQQRLPSGQLAHAACQLVDRDS